MNEITEILMSLYKSGWILLIIFMSATLLEWFDVKIGTAILAFGFIMIGYLKLEPSILSVAVTTVIYLAIGLVYSFWRYRDYLTVQLTHLKTKYTDIDVNNIDSKYDGIYRELPYDETRDKLQQLQQLKDKVKVLKNSLNDLKNNSSADKNKILSHLSSFFAGAKEFKDGNQLESQIQSEISSATANLIEAVTEHGKFVLNREVANLSPIKNMSLLVSWITCWPFSLLVNVTRDLVKLIEAFVRRFSLGVYNKIYNSLVSKAMTDS